MTAQTTIEKTFSTMRLFKQWDFETDGSVTKTAPYSSDITAVWAMINTDLTDKTYPATGTAKVTINTAGIKATLYNLYKEIWSETGEKPAGWLRFHASDSQLISDVASYAVLSVQNAAVKAGMDTTGAFNDDFAIDSFGEEFTCITVNKTTNNLKARNNRFVVTPADGTFEDVKVQTTYSVEDGLCKLVIADDNVDSQAKAQEIGEAVDAYCDSFAVISQEVE